MARIFPKKRGKRAADKSQKARSAASTSSSVGSGNGNGQGPQHVAVFSDLHCGHFVGLTPPEFDADPHTTQDQSKYSLSGLPERGPWSARQLMEARALAPGVAARIRAGQLYAMRRMCWDWLMKELEPLKPQIDLAIWNGDLIDGKGPKSGQTELLTADRGVQSDMAAAVIAEVGAPVNMIAYGTPYHTGASEDWEDEVAAKAPNVAKIGSSDWVEVNGVTIGYKHHCGRSSIPHGHFTPIAKQKLWELLWAERGDYPNSDILVRSHVHHYRYCGGPGWVAMTTPALQGYGSKINRFALGLVDFGFVWITVYGPGDFQWEARTLQLRRAQDAVVRL